MAWRIHDKITHGEIDNRKKGQVEGRLWLAGSDQPIVLRLKGNCWSDLAGCRLVFTNPKPDADSPPALDPLQNGVVGDMTASRKVRVPTVGQEELNRLIEENKPIPTQLGNSIYLEWFSQSNGRVVLEAAHYECELSPREWSLTPEEETRQRKQNEENLQEFLQNLVNQQSLLDVTQEPSEEAPLDEFQWEQLLRQSDAITDKYLAALEQYRDDPDCDRLVAEAMGWEWLIEDGDLPAENPLFDFVKDITGGEICPDDADDDSSVFAEDGEDDADENDEDLALDEDDDEIDDHPLAVRARELACHIYKKADERNLLNSQDATMISLLTCSTATAAKLAGGLNSAAFDEFPDYGFMIATLKRALAPLHQAIAAADRLGREIPEESSWLHAARDELFSIRQETITLMQDFRKKLQE